MFCLNSGKFIARHGKPAFPCSRPVVGGTLPLRQYAEDKRRASESLKSFNAVYHNLNARINERIGAYKQKYDTPAQLRRAINRDKLVHSMGQMRHYSSILHNLADKGLVALDPNKIDCKPNRRHEVDEEKFTNSVLCKTIVFDPACVDDFTTSQDEDGVYYTHIKTAKIARVPSKQDALYLYYSEADDLNGIPQPPIASTAKLDGLPQGYRFVGVAELVRARPAFADDHHLCDLVNRADGDREVEVLAQQYQSARQYTQDRAAFVDLTTSEGETSGRCAIVTTDLMSYQVEVTCNDGRLRLRPHRFDLDFTHDSKQHFTVPDGKGGLLSGVFDDFVNAADTAYKKLLEAVRSVELSRAKRTRTLGRYQEDDPQSDTESDDESDYDEPPPTKPPKKRGKNIDGPPGVNFAARLNSVNDAVHKPYVAKRNYTLNYGPLGYASAAEYSKEHGLDVVLTPSHNTITIVKCAQLTWDDWLFIQSRRLTDDCMDETERKNLARKNELHSAYMAKNTDRFPGFRFPAIRRSFVHRCRPSRVRNLFKPPVATQCAEAAPKPMDKPFSDIAMDDLVEDSKPRKVKPLYKRMQHFVSRTCRRLFTRRKYRTSRIVTTPFTAFLKFLSIALLTLAVGTAAVVCTNTFYIGSLKGQPVVCADKSNPNTFINVDSSITFGGSIYPCAVVYDIQDGTTHSPAYIQLKGNDSIHVYADSIHSVMLPIQDPASSHKVISRLHNSDSVESLKCFYMSGDEFIDHNEASEDHFIENITLSDGRMSRTATINGTTVTLNPDHRVLEGTGGREVLKAGVGALVGLFVSSRVCPSSPLCHVAVIGTSMFVLTLSPVAAEDKIFPVNGPIVESQSVANVISTNERTRRSIFSSLVQSFVSFVFNPITSALKPTYISPSQTSPMVGNSDEYEIGQQEHCIQEFGCLDFCVMTPREAGVQCVGNIYDVPCPSEYMGIPAVYARAPFTHSFIWEGVKRVYDVNYVAVISRGLGNFPSLDSMSSYLSKIVRSAYIIYTGNTFKYIVVDSETSTTVSKPSNTNPGLEIDIPSYTTHSAGNAYVAAKFTPTVVYGAYYKHDVTGAVIECATGVKPDEYITCEYLPTCATVLDHVATVGSVFCEAAKAVTPANTDFCSHGVCTMASKRVTVLGTESRFIPYTSNTTIDVMLTRHATGTILVGGYRVTYGFTDNTDTFTSSLFTHTGYTLYLVFEILVPYSRPNVSHYEYMEAPFANLEIRFGLSHLEVVLGLNIISLNATMVLDSRGVVFSPNNDVTYLIRGPTTASCVCQLGYTGEHCDIDINECVNNPCYAGTCVNLPGNYHCRCSVGFVGRLCDQRVGDCTNCTGTCSVSPTGTLDCLQLTGQACNCSYGLCVSGGCECDPRFTGVACDIDVNECPRCQYGSCANYYGGYVCTCLDGYYGTFCDIIGCTNGDVSVAGDACTCHVGYRGTHCDTDIDECLESPCPYCVNTIGSYYCKCPTGLTGPSCDEDVDECLLLGATCPGCRNYYGSYSCRYDYSSPHRQARGTLSWPNDHCINSALSILLVSSKLTALLPVAAAVFAYCAARHVEAYAIEDCVKIVFDDTIPIITVVCEGATPFATPTGCAARIIGGCYDRAGGFYCSDSCCVSEDMSTCAARYVESINVTTMTSADTTTSATTAMPMTRTTAATQTKATAQTKGEAEELLYALVTSVIITVIGFTLFACFIHRQRMRIRNMVVPIAIMMLIVVGSASAGSPEHNCVSTKSLDVTQKTSVGSFRGMYIGILSNGTCIEAKSKGYRVLVRAHHFMTTSTFVKTSEILVGPSHSEHHAKCPGHHCPCTESKNCVVHHGQVGRGWGNGCWRIGQGCTCTRVCWDISSPEGAAIKRHPVYTFNQYSVSLTATLYVRAGDRQVSVVKHIVGTSETSLSGVNLRVTPQVYAQQPRESASGHYNLCFGILRNSNHSITCMHDETEFHDMRSRLILYEGGASVVGSAVLTYRATTSSHGSFYIHNAANTFIKQSPTPGCYLSGTDQVTCYHETAQSGMYKVEVESQSNIDFEPLVMHNWKPEAHVTGAACEKATRSWRFTVHSTVSFPAMATSTSPVTQPECPIGIGSTVCIFNTHSDTGTITFGARKLRCQFDSADIARFDETITNGKASVLAYITDPSSHAWHNVCFVIVALFLGWYATRSSTSPQAKKYCLMGLIACGVLFYYDVARFPGMMTSALSGKFNYTYLFISVGMIAAGAMSILPGLNTYLILGGFALLYWTVSFSQSFMGKVMSTLSCRPSPFITTMRLLCVFTWFMCLVGLHCHSISVLPLLALEVLLYAFREKCNISDLGVFVFQITTLSLVLMYPAWRYLPLACMSCRAAYGFMLDAIEGGLQETTEYHADVDTMDADMSVPTDTSEQTSSIIRVIRVKSNIMDADLSVSTAERQMARRIGLGCFVAWSLGMIALYMLSVPVLASLILWCVLCYHSTSLDHGDVNVCVFHLTVLFLGVFAHPLEYVVPVIALVYSRRGSTMSSNPRGFLDSATSAVVGASEQQSGSQRGARGGGRGRGRGRGRGQVVTKCVDTTIQTKKGTTRSVNITTRGRGAAGIKTSRMFHTSGMPTRHCDTTVRTPAHMNTTVCPPRGVYEFRYGMLVTRAAYFFSTGTSVITSTHTYNAEYIEIILNDVAFVLHKRKTLGGACIYGAPFRFSTPHQESCKVKTPTGTATLYPLGSHQGNVAFGCYGTPIQGVSGAPICQGQRIVGIYGDHKRMSAPGEQDLFVTYSHPMRTQLSNDDLSVMSLMKAMVRGIWDGKTTVTKPEDQQPGVYRLSYGSGAKSFAHSYYKDGCLLTSAHAVTSNRVRVQTSGSECFDLDLVSRDDRADWVAYGKPPVFAPVVKGQIYRVVHPELSHYVQYCGTDRFNRRVFASNHATKHGMSGCPIFNSDDEVVGVYGDHSFNEYEGDEITVTHTCHSASGDGFDRIKVSAPESESSGKHYTTTTSSSVGTFISNIPSMAAGSVYPLVSQCGEGKTTLVPPALFTRGRLGGRVLVIEPTRTLCENAYNSIARTTNLTVGFQHGSHEGTKRQNIGANIMVRTAGSVMMSLKRNRQSNPLNMYNYIVFDEFHTAKTDPTYKALYDVLSVCDNKPYLVLTMTADDGSGDLPTHVTEQIMEQSNHNGPVKYQADNDTLMGWGVSIQCSKIRECTKTLVFLPTVAECDECYSNAKISNATPVFKITSKDSTSYAAITESPAWIVFATAAAESGVNILPDRVVDFGHTAYQAVLHSQNMPAIDVQVLPITDTARQQRAGRLRKPGLYFGHDRKVFTQPRLEDFFDHLAYCYYLACIGGDACQECETVVKRVTGMPMAQLTTIDIGNEDINVLLYYMRGAGERAEIAAGGKNFFTSAAKHSQTISTACRSEIAVGKGKLILLLPITVGKLSVDLLRYVTSVCVAQKVAIDHVDVSKANLQFYLGTMTYGQSKLSGKTATLAFTAGVMSALAMGSVTPLGSLLNHFATPTAELTEISTTIAASVPDYEEEVRKGLCMNLSTPHTIMDRFKTFLLRPRLPPFLRLSSRPTTSSSPVSFKDVYGPRITSPAFNDGTLPKFEYSEGWSPWRSTAVLTNLTILDRCAMPWSRALVEASKTCTPTRNFAGSKTLLSVRPIHSSLTSLALGVALATVAHLILTGFGSQDILHGTQLDVKQMLRHRAIERIHTDEAFRMEAVSAAHDKYMAAACTVVGDAPIKQAYAVYYKNQNMENWNTANLCAYQLGVEQGSGGSPSITNHYEFAAKMSAAMGAGNGTQPLVPHAAALKNAFLAPFVYYISHITIPLAIILAACQLPSAWLTAAALVYSNTDLWQGLSIACMGLAIPLDIVVAYRRPQHALRVGCAVSVMCAAISVWLVIADGNNAITDLITRWGWLTPASEQI